MLSIAFSVTMLFFGKHISKIIKMLQRKQAMLYCVLGEHKHQCFPSPARKKKSLSRNLEQIILTTTPPSTTSGPIWWLWLWLSSCLEVYDALRNSQSRSCSRQFGYGFSCMIPACGCWTWSKLTQSLWLFKFKENFMYSSVIMLWCALLKIDTFSL